MENLFAALTQEDSIAFLLSVLVAFLIGFITAWVLWGGRAARSRREAKKWKGSYDTVQREHTTLSEQLDLRDADLVKAHRQVEELAAHIRLVEEEKATWQASLDDSLNAVAQANSNARSYAATIEALNDQILGLKARLSQQEGGGSAQPSATQSQVAKMKSSDDATLSRLNSLEEKIGQLLAENIALRTQTPASGSEVASPKKEAIAAPGTQDGIAIAPADSVAAQKAVMSALGSKIPAAAADAKDDLTLIRGIGSFVEKKLNGLGIYTYEQISRFDSEMIENVTAAIAFFPGRIKRDDWVSQASRLMEIKSTQPEALGKAAIFPNNPQDLKIVEGIGPKIEKLLKKAGISTWEALAKTKQETLQKILEEAGDAYRIHDPTTWTNQAKLALNGEWEKLKEYQDYLKGGKGVS